jgi:circadian clock protein KaiC
MRLESEAMNASPRSDNKRAATGVPGLDEILGGGLPRERIYLVQGDPGVGKTTLALQFLLAGAEAGETCLYLTLSETEEELRGVAESHGWSLDKLSLFELPNRGDYGEENTMFHPSEVELAETTKTLLDEVARVKPTRVVFDSLSEIRLLSQGALRYRRQVLALKQFFVGRNCTVLLLDDRTSDPGDLQLQSLAHGVLSLEQLSPLYGAERRRMRVLKLRGVSFRGGYHDFALHTGGMQLFPRLVAADHRDGFRPGEVLSGVAEIDALVGGGLTRGTSTLLMGPAGTGKSTVAMQYARAAAAAGEHAAIFAFDESVTTLLARSAGVGQDLEKEIASGAIEIRQVDPAELAPGEFAHAVRAAVEERGARVIIIDSLNGYLHAMPEEHFLTLQLHELLTYLGQRGVITLMVVAQHGLVGAAVQSPIDVSYLADAVMVFRYVEMGGQLRKAISMLKRRTGGHERTIRELSIGKTGLQIGEPLHELQGLLTGFPNRAQDFVRDNG